MPAKRLSMRKIRDVLRLHFQGRLTNRQIARSLGLGRATVAEYLRRAGEAGLGWPLPAELDEATLEQRLFPQGTIKDAGKIYLQSVVEAFCSVGFSKLYLSKVPMTAVDVLDDRVLPFCEEHGVGVDHVLTDNGREYCGRPLQHAYELYPATSTMSTADARRSARRRPMGSVSGSIGR